MDRIDELQDKVDELMNLNTNSLIGFDSNVKTEYKFRSSSKYVAIDVIILTKADCRFSLTFNGEKYNMMGNFFVFEQETKKNNSLIVEVTSGGLLSKRVEIKGIGVKWLT